MSESRPFFVAGEWCARADSEPVVAPWDGARIADVSQADGDAASAAIDAASSAFRSVGRRASSRQRGEWLEFLRAAVRERRDEIATTMAQEMGKPLKFARVEVDRCLYTLREGEEEARRLTGEYLPLDVIAGTDEYWGIVRRVPVGPVLGIVPFNFPCNLLAHKLAPALAAGCPIVIKPSPKAPLTPLLMAAAVEDAGIPSGMVSVLPCSDEVAGELVADERFELLSFTGSPAVGWYLKSIAGKKRVHLELGNNSGVVIHEDCPDVEWAARRCALGAFAQGGQSCISVQRVFVHRPLYDDFVGKLAAAAGELIVGDPLEEATDVGPLVDEASAIRVEEWIEEARAAGADVVCGGGRDGSVVSPTVLTNVVAEARIQRQEVFGPVLTVTPYDDFEAALGAVNDTSLGLQAGVFTRDLGRIRLAWDNLEVGAVCINDYPTFRVDNMPYGGVKDSGLGREGVRYALEAYTEPRLLIINGGPRRMPSVDPRARVHPDARLADGVTVDAGATVEAGVTIGAGSHIGSSAVLYSGTEVGDQVTVGVGAVLGGTPQDLKFAGGESGVRIGDRTVVREYVTVHRCVEPGGVTLVGSDCLLMATSHVAHECVLGDAVIVANGVMLAGHVSVGGGVFLSGNVVVHQFTRLGRLAMIGGGSAVRQDVVPFCVADGHPARPLGLNTVGLQRAGFSTATVRELKRAYRILFARGTQLPDRLDRLAELAASADDGSEEVAEMRAFVKASERGVARPRERVR